MIRIQEDKLIIEIECHGGAPLAQLSHFKWAFNELLRHIEYTGNSGKLQEDKADAMKWYAEFLNHMELTFEQNEVIHQHLKVSGFKKFNDWTA